MNVALLIAAIMLCTYASRAIPALLTGHLHLSVRMRKFLELIPLATMSALIFPSVFTTDPQYISIGLIGGLTAFVSAWCKAPIIVSVLLSILAVFLCYTTGFVF